MSRFVALFSGINVGGNRIVKMAELKAFFESLGFADVATYVQSGNVVFRANNGDAAALSKEIEAAFEKKWGFNSRMMVRDAGWLERLVKNSPYPEIAGDPTKLHAYALDREPTQEEAQRLADKCTGPERFDIKDDVLYLHSHMKLIIFVSYNSIIENIMMMMIFCQIYNNNNYLLVSMISVNIPMKIILLLTCH